MTITHHRRGNLVVLHLVGELDLATADELVSHLRELLVDNGQDVLIDLSRLAFCDARGLACLVQAREDCAAAAGSLRITGAVGSVARVLRLTGLDRALAN